jgi:glycosyltransferase involved in cell wall biosynthesis
VVLQPEINGEISGAAYTWGTRFEKGPVAFLVAAAVRLRNLFFRDATAAVAMSRAIRDELAAGGFAPDRVAWLPHGVDTERFRPAAAGEKDATRRRLGLPVDAVVFCYTGRLLRGKGLDVLVAAFAEVVGEEPRAHLAIVGSGKGQALSVEESLAAEVTHRGLGEHVTFAGRVDAVDDWLRAADVFVFPSRNEALGISLIEAAAAGLPSVASRTGGIVDVVRDGETGLLVEPGDAKALAGAMRGLLRDPGRRAALGAAAREDAVGRFDFAASVVRYRALLAEAAR